MFPFRACAPGIWADTQSCWESKCRAEIFHTLSDQCGTRHLLCGWEMPSVQSWACWDLCSIGQGVLWHCLLIPLHREPILAGAAALPCHGVELLTTPGWDSPVSCCWRHCCPRAQLLPGSCPLGKANMTQHSCVWITVARNTFWKDPLECAGGCCLRAAQQSSERCWVLPAPRVSPLPDPFPKPCLLLPGGRHSQDPPAGSACGTSRGVFSLQNSEGSA